MLWEVTRCRLIRWICGKPIRSHVVDGKQVTRPTTIAVVGLSNKEGRPSFRVARKMVKAPCAHRGCCCSPVRH